MSRRALSFLGGMMGGYRLGSQMVGDYEDAELKKGLGDAGSANSVTETVTGDEAKKAASNLEAVRNEEYNRARDAAVAQGEDGSAAGLAAAQQYDPALQELRGRGDKPEFSVMNKGNVVGTHANAMGAQTATDAANTRGMGDVYKQFGRPEAANRLQQQAQSLEAGALALKGAKREDTVQEAAAPLKLAQVQFEVDTWPQELEKKVMAKEISFDDAQREVVKRFAASVKTVPEVAMGWLNNGFLGKAFPQLFKDAVDLNREGDNLVVSYKDGSKKSAPLSALDNYGKGGTEPVKFTTVSEGSALVAHDSKGNTKEVYRAPKTADPSKNNAAMDDAVATMTRLLETNKNMMTQFGGNEQKAREEMRLNHDKGIGEFQRRAGRAPTVEEAAIIAEGVFKKAQAKYLGGK